MHEIVHTLHAALLIRAVGMVEESANYQFALEIVWIELAQLGEDVGEFPVGLWERLHRGFEPACQYGGDGMELTCAVAPHLAALSRSVLSAAAVRAKGDRGSFEIRAFCSAFAVA
jgi:hypothetical protein